MRRAAARRLAVYCVGLLLLTASAPRPHVAAAVLPSSSPARQNSTTAGEVLLQFKASVSNWAAVTARFQGWTDGYQTPCAWTGVTCNNDYEVTQLVLRNVGLSAPIPQQLTQLRQLITLDLSSNRLFGTLPVAWGNRTYPKLQTLALSGNMLEGSLPAAWGSPKSFPALTSMLLASNSLTGGLPSTWADTRSLRSLQILDVSKNRMSGPLPGSWGGDGAFRNLTVLALSNNFFRGSLPDVWGGTSFKSLTKLVLYNNTLTGTLPASWGGAGYWRTLVQMLLYNNQLQGSIPADWHNRTAFPALASVVVRPGNQKLCGTLPLVTRFQVLSQPAVGMPAALTGTLGTCATQCGSLKTSGNVTNLYGIAVDAGVAIRDLLALNPDLDTGKAVPADTTLVRPCYLEDPPTYLGANIAYGQAATQSSTVGAGVASAAVAFSTASSVERQCTLTTDGTRAAPAWWRVDLGISTKVAGLVLASETAIEDLRILVGDSTNALANQECAVGVQVVANSSFSQICSGKGRYVTVTRVSGLAVSLCGVEVFPQAANAAIAKSVTTSSGSGVDAVDGVDANCATAEARNGEPAAWLTVDLGYRGQLAAVGVDLGTNDVTQLSLRVGNVQPVKGDENEACQPSVSNLPGYSKTLFTCTLTGQYITILAQNAARTLDVCLVTTFLQEAPTQELAISPSSELTVGLGPAVATTSEGSGNPASAPSPEDYSPGDIVNLGFRLVLIGPRVVEFDGKEVAVVNALNVTLRPVDPVSIQITSYTVGAPVPNIGPQQSPPPLPPAPPPPTRRRLSAISTANTNIEIFDPQRRSSQLHLRPPSLPSRSVVGSRRGLLQQVSEGAVIINVVIRTTAVKLEATTLLLQSSVASGNFTKALNDAGLQAAATRFSIVPLDAAQAPEPVPSPRGGGASPSSSSTPVIRPSRKGSKVSGAVIGGAVNGAVFFLLFVALLVWCLVRARRKKQQQQAAELHGSKADLESGSESGSLRGGKGSRNRGPQRIGCWPFTAAHRANDKRVKLASNGISREQVSNEGSHTYLADDIIRSVQLDGVKSDGSRSGIGKGRAVHAYAHSDGIVPTTPLALSERGGGLWLPGGMEPLGPLRTGSHQLLLPSTTSAQSSPTRQSGTPSGWGTPPGMRPGVFDGSGAFMSPQQQVANGMGQLGNLGLMSLDTSLFDLDPSQQDHVILEDAPPQRWTSTSAELWPITYQELTFLKQIGEGSFGRVYMARWRETTVAVKVLHRQSGDHQDEDLPLDPCPSAGSPDPILCALQKEAGIMASVRHPNVISYLGVCAEPACIVTEYCSKGSLTDVLRRGRASGAHAAALDWPRRLNMAMDAAKGMLHLHLCDPPIIHRDLKSPNLLVDKHWKLKVCDFNLSRVMEESVVLSSMVASNPRWLAPEILAGLPYTVAADVYSFGIIMWELLTWEVPWSQQNTWQVHAMVTVEQLRPDLPETISSTPGGTFGGMADYLDLMSGCWAQDPEDRPDFECVIGRLRRMLAVESIGSRHAAGSTAGGGSPTHQTQEAGVSGTISSAPR